MQSIQVQMTTVCLLSLHLDFKGDKMRYLLKFRLLPLLLVMSLSTVSTADEEKADSLNGVQVWSDTCMRCQNLREPAGLSKRAWKYSMQHMRVRAGLTGKETRDILAFILESKTDEDSK